LKEKRIKNLALLYYSRKDILESIFAFSQKRETSPRYFEGFGKRPDSFQYPSDILALVKRGATSFHCSEELWDDPLLLSTELSQEQLNDLRVGWDLIIDIDCKWIEYSKKAARAIIKSLELYGVKNIGIKFSGSKGFHIIVPWGAFPEEIDGVKTSDMFPDWPRAIVGYLKELSRPRLAELIKDSSDFSNIAGFTGIECKTCNNLADKNYRITLKCGLCNKNYIETFLSAKKDYSEKKCPHCKGILKETNCEQFFNCSRCEINSLKNPDNFDEAVISVDVFKVLGLDLMLVSPRHLFRMPYSLHEKTSLASVVINKDELENFELSDASPFNVKVTDFMPVPEKNEAKELLIHSIDWQNSSLKDVKYKSSSNIKSDFKPLKISNFDDSLYPPVIINILKGLSDGKKRGLFILLNFFRSIGMPFEDIATKLNEWNKNNKPPLKQGYINSQLVWHSRNKIILPPNFDNEIYKEIGVFETDSLSKKTKNPVNYVAIKSKSS
jgi:DNA primase catalytic subunit